LPPTPTFAYRSQGGTQDYLGPVIVAKQGVPFNLTIKNNLGPHPLAFAIDPPRSSPPAPTPQRPRAAVHPAHRNTQEAAGLLVPRPLDGDHQNSTCSPDWPAGYLIRNGDDDDRHGARTADQLPTPEHCSQLSLRKGPDLRRLAGNHR
jgi:hypothetical protein